MSNLPIKYICLTVDESLVPIFFHLLQSGFRINASVGCTVKSFLCDQLSVTPEYLEKRIQTIFLNGKPVDDVDTAIIVDGATLSLSAALPGLVGAVMRKGGYYAPMRDEISYKENLSSTKIQSGTVFMKLFNLPLRELGPQFLERGIFVDQEKLKDILTSHAGDLRNSSTEAAINDRSFTFDQLLDMAWGEGDIFLMVKTLYPPATGGKTPTRSPSFKTSKPVA